MRWMNSFRYIHIFYCCVHLYNGYFNSNHGYISRHRSLLHKQYTSRSEVLDIDKPIQSLLDGKWVKFICGASNQDLPLIRNLCYIYTLAGVDCIDISADLAVITIACDGINAAINSSVANNKERPYLMISVNDNEDLHFRKAYFDTSKCPISCSRPCEKVCPAWAIPPPSSSIIDNPSQWRRSNNSSDIDDASPGVIAEKCYGCGRCIPVCPYGIIEAKPYISSAYEVSQLLVSGHINAIEIHTELKDPYSFHHLWDVIASHALNNLQVLSISFPNIGNETYDRLQALQSSITSNQHWQSSKFQQRGAQIWQTDGRPMSGDIGRGTVHASIDLAEMILKSSLSSNNENKREEIVHSDGSSDDDDDDHHHHHRDDNHHQHRNTWIDFKSSKHFIQLAGGTNIYSSTSARTRGLLSTYRERGFGGYAFGGYARKTIGGYLNRLEADHPGARIEDHDDMLRKCLDFANTLVRSVKDDDYDVSDVVQQHSH